MPIRLSALAGGLLVSLPLLVRPPSSAQEPLPWQRGAEPRYQPRDDAYRRNEPATRAEEPATSPTPPRRSEPSASPNDARLASPGSAG